MLATASSTSIGNEAPSRTARMNASSWYV